MVCTRHALKDFGVPAIEPLSRVLEQLVAYRKGCSCSQAAFLYEPASVLSNDALPSTLEASRLEMAVVRRREAKRAGVAIAHELAVIMHRMWLGASSRPE